MKSLTQLPVVKKFVQLCLSALVITSASQAQSLPPANNCASKDLDLIETMLRSSTENSLWTGNRKMHLNVTNKTGNDKRSFSMWARLKRYDINGNLKSVTPVFFCVDSVKKYSTVTLPAKDSLYYVEGEELVLTNIYTAWSGSKQTENCDFLFANSAKISPNCATKDSIRVYTGVNTRTKVDRANCSNGKGSIKVAPFGGRAPYYVSISVDGAPALETRTVKDSTTFELAPGKYKIAIVDGKYNTSYFTRTIEDIAPTDKPQANITHPSCIMPRGQIKVLNAQNGFNYTLRQNGQVVYSSGDGNFSEVEAGDYELTAVKGVCSNKDSARVNQRPFVPAKPDVSVIHPSCTRSTGDITLNSKEKDVVYSILQNGQTLMTLADENMFANLVSGDYDVLASGQYCSNGTRAKLNVQPPTPEKPVVSATQPSFCGAGSASITSPLDARYEYSKDGSNWQSGASFTDLGSGSGANLSFQVRNSYGCVSAATTICGSGDPLAATNTLSTSQNASATEQATGKYLGAAKLNESAVVVKTIPNPFSTKVRFVITAPEAGNGVLELYNIQGQKVKTIYQGHISAGTNFFDLTLPERRRAELIYVLKMADASISGKLIQLGENK